LTDRLWRFIEVLPKAELHVHLEGTITPEVALDLACRHGHPLADRGLESIRLLYRHDDFLDFLRNFATLTEVLLHPADLYELICQYTRFARRSNIVYAEVHLTPLPLVSQEMPYRAMMQAVQRGVEDAMLEELQLCIILDTVRQWGPERFDETLDLHLKHPFSCVIAIGMGGDETAEPPQQFETQFDRARRAGLRTVVHSGESGDADSVRKTLEVLRPERILHGIRAAEDERLVKHLAEIGMVLDVCPSSNVGTGVVSSLEKHPVRKLFDAGVRVTLNTDDPPLFGTTLNREYRLLADYFDFTAEELLRVAGEAFRAAFLSEEAKAIYLQRQQEIWDAFQASG